MADDGLTKRVLLLNLGFARQTMQLCTRRTEAKFYTVYVVQLLLLLYTSPLLLRRWHTHTTKVTTDRYEWYLGHRPTNIYKFLSTAHFAPPRSRTYRRRIYHLSVSTRHLSLSLSPTSSRPEPENTKSSKCYITHCIYTVSIQQQQQHTSLYLPARIDSWSHRCHIAVQLSYAASFPAKRTTI